MCYSRGFYCLRELHEAHFHKPGIYGSGRVWANAWDVFRRTPSRGGRGRRDAVDVVVCLGCGGISCFFFRFFSSNAHGLLQVRGRLASFTSLLVYYFMIKSIKGAFVFLLQSTIFMLYSSQ